MKLKRKKKGKKGKHEFLALKEKKKNWRREKKKLSKDSFIRDENVGRQIGKEDVATQTNKSD